MGLDQRLEARSWRRSPGGGYATLGSATAAVAFSRGNVPRDNKHRPLGAPEDTFSDGTLPETLPPAPPIGTKDDEIGLPRVGMQHNRAGGVAVLLDCPHRNTFAFCAFPQAGQKFKTFALAP